MALLTALSVTTSACHDWVAVRPSEIAKMGPGSGKSDSPPRLVRTNGALVEIDDDSEVIITLNNGREILFSHPVQARMDGGVLVVRGGNHGEMRLLDQEIRKVQVSKFDGGSTAQAIVGTALLGLAIVYVGLSQTAK